MSIASRLGRTATQMMAKEAADPAPAINWEAIRDHIIANQGTYGGAGLGGLVGLLSGGTLESTLGGIGLGGLGGYALQRGQQGQDGRSGPGFIHRIQSAIQGATDAGGAAVDKIKAVPGAVADTTTNLTLDMARAGLPGFGAIAGAKMMGPKQRLNPTGMNYLQNTLRPHSPMAYRAKNLGRRMGGGMLGMLGGSLLQTGMDYMRE